MLTLGENSESGTKWYKIGHGKPIGLGSVKIVIDKAQDRSFGEDGYSFQEKNGSEIEIEEDGNSLFGSQKEALEVLKKMARMAKDVL